MLCKTDETGTEFLRTFFTFTLSFRISEEFITFRNDILDHEISVILLLTAWTVNVIWNGDCFSHFNYVVINDFVICEISVHRLPKEDLCLPKEVLYLLKEVICLTREIIGLTKDIFCVPKHRDNP